MVYKSLHASPLSEKNPAPEHSGKGFVSSLRERFSPSLPFLFPVLAFVFLSAGLLLPVNSQSRPIGNPGFPRSKPIQNIFLKKRETEHFIFIYKSELGRKEALNLAVPAEKMYAELSAFFRYAPRKIKIFLHSGGDIFNAFFSSERHEVNLYLTPVTNPEMLGSFPEGTGLENTLLHELVHYFSLKSGKGFYDFLKIFGPSAPTGTRALLDPGWSIEGVAVLLETAFSRSGRGRNPFFRMLPRSFVWERAEDGKKPFSPGQARYPWHGTFPGRHYTAGYMMNRYLKERYGLRVFQKIYGKMREELLYTTAVKKVTGKNIQTLFDDMWRYYRQKYRGISESPVYGYSFFPKKADQKEGYARPVPTDEGLYFYRIGLNQNSALLRQNPETGKTETLLSPFVLTDASSFSASQDGRTVVFASYGKYTGRESGESEEGLPSGFRIQNYLSDLYRLDLRYDDRSRLKSKRVKKLTTRKRLWHPALSPDGRNLVAVRENGLYTRLVQVDLQTGRVSPLWNLPRSFVFTPVFDPRGQSLAVFVREENQNAVLYHLRLRREQLKPEAENPQRRGFKRAHPRKKSPHLEVLRAEILPLPPQSYAPSFRDQDTLLFTAFTKSRLRPDLRALGSSSKKNGGVLPGLNLFSYSLKTGRYGKKPDIREELSDPVGIRSAAALSDGTLIYTAYRGGQSELFRVSPGDRPRPVSFRPPGKSSFSRKTRLPRKKKAPSTPEPAAAPVLGPEKNFYDFPFPTLWSPSFLFSEQSPIIGMTVRGKTYTGDVFWSLRGGYDPRWKQMSLNFNLSFVPVSSLMISYLINQSYSPEESRSSAVQRTLQTLRAEWFPVDTVTYAHYVRVKLDLEVRHQIAVSSENNFPFSRSSALPHSQSVIFRPGLFWLIQEKAPPNKILGSWLYYGGVHAPLLLLPASLGFYPNILAEQEFNIPFFFNGILTLRFAGGYSTSGEAPRLINKSYWISAPGRAAFAYRLGLSLPFSLDAAWRSLSLRDMILSLRFDNRFNWVDLQSAPLSSFFLSLDLRMIQGFNMSPFSWGTGLSLRIPSAGRAFDPRRDLLVYLEIGSFFKFTSQRNRSRPERLKVPEFTGVVP